MSAVAEDGMISTLLVTFAPLQLLKVYPEFVPAERVILCPATYCPLLEQPLDCMGEAVGVPPAVGFPVSVRAKQVGITV